MDYEIEECYELFEDLFIVYPLPPPYEKPNKKKEKQNTRNTAISQYVAQMVEMLAKKFNNNEEGDDSCKLVQKYLKGVMAVVDLKFKRDLVRTTMWNLYSLISDPDIFVSPALSYILYILHRAKHTTLLQEASRVDYLQVYDRSGIKAKMVLSHLFWWMLRSEYNRYLHNLTLEIIKTLESRKQFKILIEVSNQYLGYLTPLLNNTSKQSYADIVLHLITSLRDCPGTLDLISTIQTSSESRCTAALETPTWYSQATELETNYPQLPKNVGLHNKHSICYVNSGIQAIRLNKHLVRYTITKKQRTPYWAILSKLFAEMLYSRRGCVSAFFFYKAFKPSHFQYGRQQDSSEFLRYTISLLSRFEYFREDDMTIIRGENSIDLQDPTALADFDEILYTHIAQHNKLEFSLPPRDDSIFNRLFRGQQTIEVKCTGCLLKSSQQSAFHDIHLSYPGEENTTVNSVQCLLNAYCATKTLRGDDRYKCGNCTLPQIAEKKIIFDNAPNYLTLYLNTFEYDVPLQIYRILKKVNCNLTLTLPNEATKSGWTYDLFASVIHAGHLTTQGHFYTLGKENHRWYEFDDRSVRQCDDSVFERLPEDHIPTIYFYKRSDVNDSIVPTLLEVPPSTKELLTKDPTYISKITHRKRKMSLSDK